MRTSFLRWAGVFTLCLFSNALFAQKENAYWTFSDSLGLYFAGNNVSLVHSIVNGQFNLENTVIGPIEPQASICNANGELQFYFLPYNSVEQDFNGQVTKVNQKLGQVINKEHLLMENGDSVLHGTTATNGALILPIPQKKNEYYLFTLKYHPNHFLNAPNSFTTSLFAHKIDMSFNEGLGKVVEKNLQLHDYAFAEKLCAVRHGNGRDWWIFTHKLSSAEYVRWLLTPDGLSGPFYQDIGTQFNSYDMQGEMLFSPDGTMLAVTIPSSTCFEVLNFNRCTGLFESVYHTRCKPGNINEIWYGCAFSSGNRYLYVAQGGGLGIYQFDLAATNIDSSKTFILPAESNPDYNGGGFGQLELGPDGKIYVGSVYGGWPPVYWHVTNMNLSVINAPDSAGLACDFQPFSFSLGGRRMWYSLPHFPNFGLGALDTLQADAGPDRFLCPEKFTVIGTPSVAGRSYSWAPPVALSDTAAAMPTTSPTVTTTYTLTVTSDDPQACGGPSVDIVTVYVNETALSPDFSFVLDGFSATFESNVSDLQNYTLKWAFGSGDSSLLANPNYVFPDTGLFTVTLTVSDTSGCFESVSKTIHVSGPNNKDKNLEKSGIKIYPNPTRGNIIIENVETDTVLEIFDEKGLKVESILLKKWQNIVSIENRQKGVYLFCIRQKYGGIFTQKIHFLE